MNVNFSKFRMISDKYHLSEIFWLSVFGLILLPGSLVVSPASGLDGSWRTSLDLAIIHHLNFGSDFNFTYGPLGFLFTKQTLAHSKWWILLFELAVIGLGIFVLRKGIKNEGLDWKTNALVAGVLFISHSNELTYLLAPLFIIVLIFYFEEKKAVYLYLAAVIAVLNLYIKANYGIVLIFLWMVALAIGITYRVLSFTNLIKVLSFFILLVLATSFLLNVSLLKYLKAGLQLINSYNDAMYMEMGLFNWKLTVAVEICAIFGFGYLIYIKKLFLKPELFIGFFLSAAYGYLLFKNGYVRAEDHFIQFFRLSVIPFGILSLFVFKGKSSFWSYTTVLTFFLFFNALCILELSREVLLPLKSLAFKHQYFLKSFKNDDSKNSTPANDIYLNDKFLSTIQNKSVDIMPTEISLIQEHGLNYAPRPLIQSYSAYNLYLDSMNYKKYTSATAPEFLLFQNAGIDNRLAFWDESVTKRAMLTHYQPVLTDTSFTNEFKDQDVESRAKLLLFKKRSKPLLQKIIREEKLSLRTNKPFVIKKSKELQYLYAKIDYTLKGKIQRFLFQPPALKVKVMYADSATFTFKAVSSVLNTGILLNKKVSNTDEAMLFFESLGKANKEVYSITLIPENGIKADIDAKIVYLNVE